MNKRTKKKRKSQNEINETHKSETKGGKYEVLK